MTKAEKKAANSTKRDLSGFELVVRDIASRAKRAKKEATGKPKERSIRRRLRFKAHRVAEAVEVVKVVDHEAEQVELVEHEAQQLNGLLGQQQLPHRLQLFRATNPAMTASETWR